MIGPCLDHRAGRWDSDLMTLAAKKLLEDFDALREGDQAEVLAHCSDALPPRHMI